MPLSFLLLWSSSFIATRVGLRHLTPLLFVALRTCLCAVVLVAIMLVLRRPWSVLRDRILHLAVAGVLINGVMLMTAHVAMTRVPAAPVALIQMINPLLTTILAGPLLGERLRPLQWLGLVLGAGGVVLTFGLAAFRSRVQLDLLLLSAGGVMALCGGTLYFGRFCRGVPVLEGTTVQFIAAALASLAGMAVFETPQADWTAGAITSLLWNAGCVSLGGMALYFMMLKRGTAARASAAFYLVPGITALMAWLLLGESITPLAIAGLAVSSIGCWLVSGSSVRVLARSPGKSDI